MKRLEYHDNIGVQNEAEAFEFLCRTLKDSIFGWDFFVDFEKVYAKLFDFKLQLEHFHPLLGIEADEFDAKFIEIVTTIPASREALPLLMAVRKEKLSSTPIITNFATLEAQSMVRLFNPRTKLDDEMLQQLLYFIEQSGLKRFFVTNAVSNLVDYATGVEVGMDTNGRKNRTGTNMENLVEGLLSTYDGIQFIPQATTTKIYSEWGIELDREEINRAFDFAVLNERRELTLIEVNYYGGGGSKLKATAGEYKSLYNFLSGQGLKFIWITDGQGWNTAKTALQETFVHNDYVINLQMATDGALEEIIKQQR